MKRFLVVAFLAVSAISVTSEKASAQYPANLGYLPFGFYQPYGAHYGTSLRTPPYFATNPPVYYGARHARPYGISPFASPPMVQPGEGYRSRLRSKFSVPPVGTSDPLCNPCISHSKSIGKSSTKVAAIGSIRTNPFVDQVEPVESVQHIAQN